MIACKYCGEPAPPETEEAFRIARKQCEDAGIEIKNQWLACAECAEALIKLRNQREKN